MYYSNTFIKTQKILKMHASTWWDYKQHSTATHNN